MTQYEYLSDSDKNAIREAAMRGLEYHIYGLEQQLLIANAATEPDQNAISQIESAIAEKKAQIEVLK
jgi:predicted nucleotidyltransferase